MNPLSQAERLADMAASIATGAIPDGALDAAKSCLLYGHVMAFAAIAEREPVAALLAARRNCDGPADLIAGGKALAADAAAANAALFAARGQNDTHPALAGHVGCVVIPALLASAQARNIRGGQLLRGLIAGYEVMIALGEAFALALRGRGLRTTSQLGAAGAAVAVAAMWGLDRAQIANAIALGLDAGSGLLQCWGEGSAEWRWQAARSAAGGVTAAELAASGAVGARFAVEGEQGFANAYAAPAPPDTELHWRLRSVELKLFPGCYINQAATRALLDHLDRRGPDQDDVVTVTARLHPDDAAYPGVARYGPFVDSSAAIMSLPFMLAAALRDRQVGRAHFIKEHGEGSLHPLSRRISVVPDEAVPRYGALLDIGRASGMVERLVGEAATRADERFDALVAALRPITAEWSWPDAERRYDRLAATIRAIESRPAGDILQACRP